MKKLLKIKKKKKSDKSSESKESKESKDKKVDKNGDKKENKKEEKERKDVKDGTTEEEELEYNQEDLEMGDGLTPEDFEDPSYYSSYSSDMFNGFDVIFEFMGKFMEHDNKTLAEILYQLKESTDANTKAIQQIADELKNVKIETK
jgi:hypothetical protein